MQETLKKVLEVHPAARADYNIAFVLYGEMTGKITERESIILLHILSKLPQQKTIARRVRKLQMDFPELNYDKKEQKKRVHQEQECREKYGNNGFWNAVNRWFNKL